MQWYKRKVKDNGNDTKKSLINYELPWLWVDHSQHKWHTSGVQCSSWLFLLWIFQWWTWWEIWNSKHSINYTYIFKFYSIQFSLYPLHSSPFLSLTHFYGISSKLLCGAVFIVFSHKFTLFWLRKTCLSVESYQFSFCGFIYAFHPEISSFLG